MRSIWKGHIRFSLVTIPIQVFNAVETKHEIRFNQLHKEDNGRVGYNKICKTCNEKVSSKDIVKGFQYEPDQYVIFDNDELNAVKLKSTRAIEIEAFVDLAEVHPSRFEAVYYIGPNGDIAKKTFTLFSEVLRTSNKAGIGRIILRDREDVVLITAEKNGIVMYKLRYPRELRKMDDVPDLEPVDIDEKQLALANTLVDSLSTSFEEVDFEDRYHDALMDLVQQKVDGKQIVVASEAGEDDKPVVDIMEALKASIEEAKKKKTA